MPRNNYIPASELSNLELQNFNWQVTLSDYAPSEDILINVDRIGRLARLGGMGSMAVISYAGDISTTNPAVLSIDDQGTATAAKSTSIVRAESSQAYVPNNFGDSFYEYNWADGQIALNISEIDERVAQKGNLRSAKNWSKQIDIALRRGIVDSSRLSLITNVPKNDKSIRTPTLVIANCVFALGLAGLTGNIDPDLREPVAVATLLAGPITSDHIANKSIERSFKLRDMKLSLFPVLPYDRFLVAKALAGMSTVAKPAR